MRQLSLAFGDQPSNRLRLLRCANDARRSKASGRRQRLQLRGRVETIRLIAKAFGQVCSAGTKREHEASPRTQSARKLPQDVSRVFPEVDRVDGEDSVE